MNYNDLISKLNSSSSSQIYKTLLNIRSDLSKTQEGIKLLTDKECLKILVNFINKPNEKILDVSLSILANCSLHNDIRTLVSPKFFNISICSSTLVFHFIANIYSFSCGIAI